MRLVAWTDDNGYDHLSWVKDHEPDSKAPVGIDADPPSIEALDWTSIKKEIHNRLVSQRLTDWQKVQSQQNAVGSIITSVIRRHLIAKYRS